MEYLWTQVRELISWLLLAAIGDGRSRDLLWIPGVEDRRKETCMFMDLYSASCKDVARIQYWFVPKPIMGDGASGEWACGAGWLRMRRGDGGGQISWLSKKGEKGDEPFSTEMNHHYTSNTNITAATTTTTFAPLWGFSRRHENGVDGGKKGFSLGGWGRYRPSAVNLLLDSSSREVANRLNGSSINGKSRTQPQKRLPSDGFDSQEERSSSLVISFLFLTEQDGTAGATARWY